MPVPFAIRGIDHVVLRATDPAALERFYIEALGCSLEKRQGTLTQLRAGNAAHGAACGAEASRYGAEGQGPSVYLTDPEGNGVELKGPVLD
jgi:glyoxylase I family protein